jgi:hypothetical protein
MFLRPTSVVHVESLLTSAHTPFSLHHPTLSFTRPSKGRSGGMGSESVWRGRNGQGWFVNYVVLNEARQDITSLFARLVEM